MRGMIMTEDEEHPTTTTTHAEWGAGEPRLLVRSTEHRFEYDLTADLTRIGSGQDCELTLPGAAVLHATIEHDDRDEYVLTMHAEGEMNAASDTAGTVGGKRRETLRTGARFTAGEWELVFARAEYADHGRPYGGRIGGELEDQAPQPTRSDYTGERGGHDRIGIWEIQDD